MFNIKLYFAVAAVVILAIAGVRVEAQVSQPAMLTTGDASNSIVRYNDPLNAPGDQTFVPGLPSGASPQAIAYAGNDRVLVGDFNNSRIFVVRASDGALLSTINTSAAGYGGSGSIAVSPQHDVALASGGSSSVKIIHAPFDSSSNITSVTLPGSIPVYSTSCIVFDSTGRAFVRHSTGISVLDPPYTSVAFTMTLDTGPRPSITITPDGNTLLATGSNGITSYIFIYHAPFSASSTFQLLPGFSGVEGIRITPDGTKALAVGSESHIVGAISAPFSSSSNIQSLVLPPGSAGFEHVAISDDGQTAILTGRNNTEPPVLIRGPFTHADAVSSDLPVNGPNPGRGGGAVIFLPQAVVQHTPFDFDGDGRADQSVFRADADPAIGDFRVLKSSDGNKLGFSWGLPGDKIAPADYDGDGKADIAVWRESEGNFYILNSADGTMKIDNFGLAGDKLTVGDWDGDGKAEPAVYRDGAQSHFYYRGSLNNPNGDITFVPFGTSGDKPMRGDFDGDGKADAALFRPSNATWYILQSSNGQVRYENWGVASDTFVPADYDGDAKTDLAVFRNGTWYIKRSSNGQPLYMSFGLSTDTPVPADYDGDGKADVAVYRAGIWYLNRTTAGFGVVNFGLASDQPVPSAYIIP